MTWRTANNRHRMRIIRKRHTRTFPCTIAGIQSAIRWASALSEHQSLPLRGEP
jgi:hypothetical protein